MAYRHKCFFLALAICPSIHVAEEAGKSENPRRSERLGRKEGGVQSLELRRRSKASLVSETLRFEISWVEQKPAEIRARCGSEWGDWHAVKVKVPGTGEVKGLTDGAMFSFLWDNGGSWKDITSLQLSILQLPGLYFLPGDELWK